MTWTAPDMSDRISVDEHRVVTNQHLKLGRFAQGSGGWVFRMDSTPYDPKAYECCAPYVVKFIENHLALLNITARLTS